MNEIKLRGLIRDIKPSHSIGDIEYDKANLIVSRDDGTEDVINLRFKKFSNSYKEDQEVELVGNVRSYSRQLDNGKNKVDIYVFTYFDKPSWDVPQYFEEYHDKLPNNELVVDGRICKIDELRTLSNGKKNVHFIIANNLVIGDGNQKLNSYLPCIAWGKAAADIAKLSVNSKITIYGKLQSREYHKKISDEEFEIRVAHEVFVKSFTTDD